MITFEWKILESTCDNESITHAKYYCKASDGENFVETEGNAYGDFSFGIVYSEITEQNVIDSVKKLYIQDDINLIESNLEKQLKSVKKEVVLPPWHVETFKVEV
jgi:hypothetical protein